MRILILFAFLVSFCRCSSDSDDQRNVYHGEDRTYYEIRDRLYIDSLDNVYLRTEDRSGADSPDPEENKRRTRVRWLYTLYCDTCILYGSDTLKGIGELKDIVDVETFHWVSVDSLDGSDVYEDRYHKYYHKWMADGGVISLYKN